MVDVVDLLGESTDDEDEDNRISFTAIVPVSSSARSSHGGNGMIVSQECCTTINARPFKKTAATRPTAVIAAAASKELRSIYGGDGCDDDDSCDEVLWIPTPRAMSTAVAKTNTTTSTMAMNTTAAATTTTNGVSAVSVSARKPPPTNVYYCDSNDEDDVEVLVVESSAKPPPSRTFLSQTQTPPASISSAKSQKPNSYSAKNRNNIFASSERRLGSVKSSLLNSDSDDDFLLQSKASGLSGRPSKLPHRPGLSDDEKNNNHSRITTPSTPLTSTTSSNSVVDVFRSTSGSGSQNQPPPSTDKRGVVLRNPYAKTKTPPGREPATVSQNSSGDRSWASSSSSSIDFRSPFASKCKGGVVNNPYKNSSSSRTSSGKKRSRPNTAVAKEAVTTASTPPSTTSPLACGIGGPKLRENTKMYPDLRPNILLALWKFARSNLVRDSYQGKRLDRFAGRIVDLAVAAPDFPIRSIGEYAVRKRGDVLKHGCGGLAQGNDALRRFEEELSSTGAMNTTLRPLPGKYVSIAEACLVAMKDTIAARWKHRHKAPTAFPVDQAGQAVIFSQRDYYVSLVELIPQIDGRLRPECPSRLGRRDEPDHGASYHLSGSTRSAEFKQLEKLLAPVEIPRPDGSIETTSYLKKRMVGGKQHYQLTPLGFQKAVVISKRAFPDGHYRSSNLRRVPPKYDPICLAVDFREGGIGDRHRRVLHEMCNKLDLLKIPYFVNTLRIGDYCFFSGEKLCPILVERKSIEDVAKTIDTDNDRWNKQKHRMYQGQYVFGYQNCKIAYIIEGKVERHLVSNGFVGNAKHKVSKERFEREVACLEEEGFEVLRTCSVENSMFELARWAESVARDVRSGKLPLKFTYNEFVSEVSKIPRETDFSRLARYHMEDRKRKEKEQQQQKVTSVMVDLVSDGESDGGHEGNLCPIILDERLRTAEKRPASESNDARSDVAASARKRFRLESLPRNEAKGKASPGGNGSPAAAHATSPAGHPAKAERGEENESAPLKNEYAKWTVASLRQKCVELGMKKSGSKTEIIERLLDPANRPPPVYRLRQERGLYVPAKPDTSSTAILVAIQIKQDGASSGVERYGGATKDEIYAMAEEIGIKKDPFCGGTTQTGPYHYDGWSSMRFLKEPGDPPLVIEKKRRFRLSTTGDVSGLKLARAMHIWCHKRGICRCIEQGYEFDSKKWT